MATKKAVKRPAKKSIALGEQIAQRKAQIMQKKGMA
jgi:hypothetical protein